MKEIPLTRGKVALVDDEDFESVSKFKWFALCCYGGLIYALRRSHQNEPAKPSGILLHRFILGIVYDKTVEVDHQDGNGLNCTRQNIRACTHAENLRNMSIHRTKTKTVGFKGVHRRRNSHRYQAYITISGKRLHLGFFNDPVLAARAYDEAARKYHGEFARLNFPDEVRASND